MKTLLATALFACLSASPPADAAVLEGALKDFKAILFDYFRNQPDPVIPIFLPAGEKPGDVYRDVFGGYFARQAECFNNVSVYKEESRFQEAVESATGNLSGNVQAQFTEAARVGGGVGVKMGDSVTIRFRDVSANVASDVALMTAFKKTSGLVRRSGNSCGNQAPATQRWCWVKSSQRNKRSKRLRLSNVRVSSEAKCDWTRSWRS